MPSVLMRSLRCLLEFAPIRGPRIRCSTLVTSSSHCVELLARYKIYGYSNTSDSPS